MSAATSERMTDYYAAREAQEIRLEAATGTRQHTHEEADRFFQRAGTAGAGETPLTYKEWLRQTTRPPAEQAQVQAVCIQLVQDAHQRMLDAEAAFHEACRIRDMELADAADAGLTYRQLAPLVGVSSTIVGKCILRARAR